MKKGIAILLSLIMVLLMAGCGKTESPSEVADKFFKAIKEKDSETISEIYEGNDLDLSKAGGEMMDDDSGLSKEVQEKFIEKIFDFDYEISDEEIKDDEATVKVKITSYALGDMIASVYTDLVAWAVENMFDAPSEEDTAKKTSEIFTEKLDETEKTFTKEMNLKLVKKDDKWIVSKDLDSDDLLNAITGDMGKKVESLSDSFGE